ncbi:MAG TPA: enoyl-CoA hydratase/isomerase family protein [Thermoleophilaceae bacterium]|nr:enoyl-CoA hydratase/isomerase family protein [Thermoleophilaceae bacterium]
MGSYVNVESRGELALVRLDRPPANALNPQLLEELEAARKELVSSLPAAVVVAGREGFFSAGVDLKLVPTLDADGQRAMVDGINRLVLGWYGFPRPVVAAVTGHAIAGGMVIALCADYRVGASEGKLGLTELRAGVPYPVGAIALVRAELPAPSARALALRAHLVEPDEALRLGLVDELAGPGDVLERACDVAREMAQFGGDAYRRTKLELRGERLRQIEAAVEAGDPLLGSWLDDSGADAAASVPRPDRK